MAKANIERADGTTIIIDGDADEVARIVSLIQQDKPPVSPRKAKDKGGKKRKLTKKDYILELKDEGFFGERRSLPDIKKALEDNGHIYPMSSLSGPILELVRARKLGRLKEGRKWMYVQR